MYVAKEASFFYNYWIRSKFNYIMQKYITFWIEIVLTVRQLLVALHNWLCFDRFYFVLPFKNVDKCLAGMGIKVRSNNTVQSVTYREKSRRHITRLSDSDTNVYLLSFALFNLFTNAFWVISSNILNTKEILKI